MKHIIIALALFLLLAGLGSAQTEQSHWTRTEAPVKLDLELFRSGHAISLPTTETLQKGDLEFEISHRFSPPVSKGSNYLWGLDGPINMRLGLGYALTNKIVITAAISNAEDNNDWRLKYKLLQLRNPDFPIVVALQGGAAWNREVYVEGRNTGDSRNFQYYGQLIINTMIKKKLGIGLVPSYLQNSDIYSTGTKHSITVGSYLEYYLNSIVGVLAEWSPVIDGYHRGYTPAAFGVEFNTGGHFFKIVLTNSIWLNPSQYLAGTDYKFKSSEWRLGFNITRLLRFKK